MKVGRGAVLGGEGVMRGGGGWAWVVALRRRSRICSRMRSRLGRRRRCMRLLGSWGAMGRCGMGRFPFAAMISRMRFQLSLRAKTGLH